MKQRKCVRTERKNKHAVVRMNGAKQLPFTVKAVFGSFWRVKKEQKL